MNRSWRGFSRRCRKGEKKSMLRAWVGRRIADAEGDCPVTSSRRRDSANRFMRLRNVVSSSSGDGAGRAAASPERGTRPNQVSRTGQCETSAPQVESLEHAQSPNDPPVVTEPEPEPLAVGSRFRTLAGHSSGQARARAIVQPIHSQMTARREAGQGLGEGEVLENEEHVPGGAIAQPKRMGR